MENKIGGIITILVDYNMEGQAMMLWRTLNANNWLDLYPLKSATLFQVGLPSDSSDRKIWRFVQKNGMILLTANRRMKGKDSLEQTIREENTTTSTPVLTISNADRMTEKVYREKCAERLMEIVLDLDKYLGTRHIFIP